MSIQAPGSLQIRPRDLALLRTLFESRILTNAHAAALHFDESGEAAKKRIQKLKAAGFIGERPRRAFDPAVLFLTRKGHDMLKAEGVLNEYPPLDSAALERRARVGDLKIRHELAVMDVKVAFHAAIKKQTAATLEDFSTWPRLYEFITTRPGHGGREFPVKPDGYLHIKEKAAGRPDLNHRCFLEVDRHNEVVDILADKALSYLNYYRSGDFAVWNGGSRSETKDYPFRVLMVFNTAERLNNIAERLLQGTPPILTLVLMSTFAEVTADPLGAIWVRPQEYREATKGTRFYPEAKRQGAGYKRQTERDKLLEKNIRKLTLLG